MFQPQQFLNVLFAALRDPTDHEVFEGGTSITGSLVLEGAPLSAKEVKLVFRGEERTRVVEKASKKAAEAACQLHRSEHIVPGIARSGRITKKETPFEIPIPDDLPQTVTIPWTHLSYFVAFEVEDRKGRIVDKGEEKVIILAKQIIHQPSPFVREPFSEYVKKNRFKKGNLIITARIDDVVLEPGQVVGVQVAIRNRSPLKVEKVKALLKQEVHATAVENEREAERILTFHEFKEYRKTKRKRKKWLRGTDLQEDMDALQDEVEEEEHAGELRVPKVRNYGLCC